MEVSGIVFPLSSCSSIAGKSPCYTGALIGAAHSTVLSANSRLPCKMRNSTGDSAYGASVRPKLLTRFSDKGHIGFYNSLELRRETMKEEAKAVKKTMKLVKGLSKDLSTFSGMGFVVDGTPGLMGEVKAKMLSEAAGVLLAHLRELREEVKAMKRRRKADKKMATRTNSMSLARNEDSSSAVSSDFSDSDLAGLGRLRSGDITKIEVDTPSSPKIDKRQTVLIERGPLDGEAELSQNLALEPTAQKLSTQRNEEMRGCGGNGGKDAVSEVSKKRIEVCMGGKCRKSGAKEILQELERTAAGNNVDVVGCKCMGNCSNGPNVRVPSQYGEKVPGSARKSSPHVLRVGVEDVATILQKNLRRGDVSLVTA